MSSYQYRKSHCGDKTFLWLSYISRMGFPILVRRHLYIESEPRSSATKNFFLCAISALRKDGKRRFFYDFLYKFSTRRVKQVCPIQCEYLHQQSEIITMLLALSYTVPCRAQSSYKDCDWNNIYIHLICLYLELFTADHCYPVCNRPRSLAGSHIST